MLFVQIESLGKIQNAIPIRIVNDWSGVGINFFVIEYKCRKSKEIFCPTKGLTFIF